MSDKPEDSEPVVNITNDEKVKVNGTVNKKLAEMSKEAKKGKAKRKLQKPEASSKDDTTLTSNQIYMLLAVAGVIIAGASLYYQRKSAIKNEKSKVKVETPEEQAVLRPVVVDLTHRSPGSEPSSPQLPGMYSF